MKKRFVVLLDATTKEQSDAFLAAARGKGLSWWHWIRNAWLFVDSSGAMTASELRELADVHYPGVDKIVLELRPDGSDTWSGYGPTKEGKNMFSWVQKNWVKS